MKTPLFLSLTALALAAGCGDNSGSTATPATNSASASSSSGGGGVLTAPVDYLAAAGRAQQQAVKTVDTASINQAIQLFQVDHGRNPTDLNELVKDKYLPYIPQTPYGTKLEYDANSGQVKVVKQ